MVKCKSSAELKFKVFDELVDTVFKNKFEDNGELKYAREAVKGIVRRRKFSITKSK